LSATLDKIDLKLIELLSANGRVRRNELAEVVGLSIPSVSERLEKLQDKGVIKGYTVIVDDKKLGFDITVFIRVVMESSKYYETFLEKVSHEDEIVECHSITGEGSHILKARTQNTGSLEKLLARIQSWQGVAGTQTSVVLSSNKESHKINALKIAKHFELHEKSHGNHR